LMVTKARQQWALRRSMAHKPDVFDRSMSADLTQMSSLILPDQPSHVVFTATPAARTPQAYQDIYQNGLGNLLAGLDINALQRFVFISSTAVYGPSSQW